MNFDLSIAGQVVPDVVEAKETFHRKLNHDLLDISLSMMVDLFGDIYEHIIPDQKFFNKVC